MFGGRRRGQEDETVVFGGEGGVFEIGAFDRFQVGDIVKAAAILVLGGLGWWWQIGGGGGGHVSDVVFGLGRVEIEYGRGVENEGFDGGLWIVVLIGGDCGGGGRVFVLFELSGGRGAFEVFVEIMVVFAAFGLFRRAFVAIE